MNQVKNVNRFLFSYLPYLLFFLISFVYFGFFADYIGFYQEKSSLFLFSNDYLVQNLHQPGGFLVYLGKLFTAFFYYPVLGSLFISSVLCLIVFLISWIISNPGKINSLFIPLMAGVAVFLLQTNYQYLFHNSFALMLQLALFCLTIRYMKGWLPVIIAPAWYFITGGFAWIFFLMYILYQIFFIGGKGWYKIIALTGLVVLFLYISKEFLFFQPLRILLVFPYSNTDIGGQFKLFIPVAGFISILPLISRIKLRFRFADRIPVIILKLIAISIPVCLLIITSILRFDVKTRQYFHVEKMFYDNRFDDIITFNTDNPSSNILTIYLNNISLCETGKLDDRLFHFRQSPDGQTLFLTWEMYWEILRRGGYFYYTVGMINEAHRWAFENMVMRGHSPEGLKMLIKTELINGNYSMAAKYVALLDKSLFYGKDARAFRKYLFDDSVVVSDPELGEKRSIKIENDFFSITDDPYSNIELLLGGDSLNRKAMEYKLAFLMLRKDYDGIANEIPRLERCGFEKLPVHVEEVALAYQAMNEGILPDAGNLTINERIIIRFNQFLQTLHFYNDNLNAAEPVLRQRFGNTFWYYTLYF